MGKIPIKKIIPCVIIIILILTVIIGLSLIPPKEEWVSDSFREMYFLEGMEYEEFIEGFAIECPDIDTCPMETLAILASKAKTENYPIEEIPGIGAIKERAQKLLLNSRQNINDPEVFWNLHDSIKIVKYLGGFSREDVDSWLIFLGELRIKELCIELYEAEPVKEGISNYGFSMDTLEEYSTFCRLRRFSTINFLSIEEPPSVTYYKDKVEDYDSVYFDICQDLSEINANGEIHLTTLWGLNFLVNHIYCNLALSPKDAKIVEDVKNADAESSEMARVKQVLELF